MLLKMLLTKSFDNIRWDFFSNLILNFNNFFGQRIDAIYFTGDIVDHFLFDASIADMKDSITKVYELMKKTFGHIPIYPIIGNHETQNL